MSFDIDIAIVIGFLTINLMVGLYSGRVIKTLREYALGNRNFSTATIVATIAATWISGGSFTITASEVYSRGLYFIIPGLGDALSFFIVAYLYIPRMAQFLGKLSVAEMMGDLYGNRVRMITAVSGIFPAIGNVALQFSVLGVILHYWLGIAGIYVLLMSSVIILIYSTFGGIKSVTFTDMVQFFTFGIITPILAFIIWQSIANPSESFSSLSQLPEFNYKIFFNYRDPNFLDAILLFLFFMIPGIDPAIFQRISMAKNTLQASKAFIIAGLFVIIVDQIIHTFVGISLRATNVLSIDSTNVVGYIIDNYLTVGFKGLFVIGIMAMIMSTADSYINSASVLFSYDLSSSIGIKFTERTQFLFSRIASLLIGVSGLLLSMFSKNMLDLVLSTYSFYMPVVSVPLILTIFGFRSSSKTVLIGMIAGFTTVILFKIFSNMDSIIPGMLSNLVFFIGSHYLLGQAGGWIKIEEIDLIRTERKRKIGIFVQTVKNFNFIKFCKQSLPKDENIQVYFGVFCIISLFSNLYSIPKILLDSHTNLIYAICCSALTLSTILITYPFWLEKFKNESFRVVLWVIAIFYNLAFIGSLFVVIGKFNPLQIAFFMTNLVAISILVKWQTVLLVVFSGIAANFCFFNYYADDFLVPNEVNSLKFQITYLMLLITSILITFLKPKQEYLETTERQIGTLETQTKVLERDIFNFAHENYSLANRVRKMDYELEERSIRAQRQEHEIQRLGATAEKILNNVNHELRLPIGNVMNFATMLRDGLEKYDKEMLKELTDEVYKNSTRLSSMILNMLDLATLNVQKVDLRKTLVNLSEIVLDRVGTCCRVYLQDKPINFELSVQEEVMVSVDPNYMRQTIDNLVINAIKFSEKGLVKVSLTEENGQIQFTITDQGKGIPQAELSDIFQAFKIGSNSESKSSGRGVGLALCKAVIEAHGGEIKAESDEKNWAMFKFVLPLKV